jgi:hypothetical protein
MKQTEFDSWSVVGKAFLHFLHLRGVFGRLHCRIWKILNVLGSELEAWLNDTP